MSLDLAFEIETYRRDAHKFVFEALRTKDEHAASQGIFTIRNFPDELCLRATLDLYLLGAKFLAPPQARYALETGLDMKFLTHVYETGLLFIEKSRHVMATWLTCGYLLWRARRDPHQLIIVQSKKEEDAAALVYDKEAGVARISFLESNLPEHLRQLSFPASGRQCHLYFPNGSHIWGVPEGGHVIRMHNPSVVFSDEAAFQPEWGKALTATLPCITHGGQFISVSSAEPSEFMNMCETDLEQTAA